MKLDPFSYMISYRKANRRAAASTLAKYNNYLKAVEDHMISVCPSGSFERRGTDFLFKHLKDALECKMNFPDYIESVSKSHGWTRFVGEPISPAL
jgi:ferredoxin-like protein FixX